MEYSARWLRYGKEENDLNKKHEASVEISQVVTNMQHKTNIFRCVFQINRIYYFFIALHKALSVFHISCFLFKTFPPSFPSPSSRAEISSQAEISKCIRPLTDYTSILAIWMWQSFYAYVYLEVLRDCMILLYILAKNYHKVDKKNTKDSSFKVKNRPN